MKRLAILPLAALLAVSCARPAEETPSPPPPVSETAATAVADSLIRLAAPQPDQLVTSPLRVTGEARGNWYFEASFPVHLLDAAGKEIAVAPATAQGEWMTTEFVPFSAELTFTAPPGESTGTLVLEKSNASGLPEHDDSRRIPVRFAP
jgi:hypothetical protein